jgi:hypothetical protein
MMDDTSWSVQKYLRYHYFRVPYAEWNQMFNEDKLNLSSNSGGFRGERMQNGINYLLKGTQSPHQI